MDFNLTSHISGMIISWASSTVRSWDQGQGWHDWNIFYLVRSNLFQPENLHKCLQYCSLMSVIYDLYIKVTGFLFLHSYNYWGWSGGAKVLCILHLVVGKGRGGMFLFLLFLHFHSCSSFFPVPLFHLLYSLFYLFSPFLWKTTQNDPQGLTCR